MTFRIGQKVVCIDDSQPKESTIYCKRLGRTLLQLGDMSGLKRGQIYTVRGVDLDWGDESPVLFLEEIIRPRVTDELYETGFLQSRFRPVQERKQQTDISIFTNLPGVVSREKESA